MTVDLLLERLERTKETGHTKWLARCPAHDDHGASLLLHQADDGRVVLRCVADCRVADIVECLGVDLDDLFPPHLTDTYLPKVPTPFRCCDFLTALVCESLVLLQYAKKLAAGKALVEADYDRLRTCVSRFQKAVEVTND